jgi:hypothetical protein
VAFICFLKKAFIYTLGGPKEKYAKEFGDISAQQKIVLLHGVSLVSETGFKPTYKREGSRTHLLSKKEFCQIYEAAKKRIRKMEVRFVEEANPLRQALLEIYVTVATRAKHNDFDCH